MIGALGVRKITMQIRSTGAAWHARDRILVAFAEITRENDSEVYSHAHFETGSACIPRSMNPSNHVLILHSILFIAIGLCIEFNK